MAGRVTRRGFLSLMPALGLASTARGASARDAPVTAPPGALGTVPGSFPTQDPDLVREMVGVAHGNFERVRELVGRRPTLARASWDWGFGDWETALGAASHMGNREIALYLLAHGARPTIFSAAMLGQLDVVKAFVAAAPGVQRTHGPHGITLLAHAKAGGDQAASVVSYLEGIGDADVRQASRPLSDGEIAMLAGTYVFGDGAEDRLVVSDSRGGLSLARADRVPRPLIHLGSYVFHPSAADAVRVRFDLEGDRAVAVTIEDADLVIEGRRVGV